MSGDLTVNKILGACLATGIVIMVVGTAAGAIYHREAPEKPGYLIEVAEAEDAGGGEADREREARAPGHHPPAAARNLLAGAPQEFPAPARQVRRQVPPKNAP